MTPDSAALLTAAVAELSLRVDRAVARRMPWVERGNVVGIELIRKRRAEARGEPRPIDR